MCSVSFPISCNVRLDENLMADKRLFLPAVIDEFS
jgi:hypothetical protein